MATLKEERQAWEHKESAYQASLMETQKAAEAANLKLHEAGQKLADLLGSLAPLRAEVAKLRVVAETSKALGKKLNEVEGELAAKTEALSLLQSDHDKSQAEGNKLQVEKEFLEKQLAAKVSEIGELEKANRDLLNDMIDTFDEGFKEALAQTTCENPGINTSNCDPGNHIVDGKVVALDLGERTTLSRLLSCL